MSQRRAARCRWRVQAARLIADAYLSEPLRSRLPNRTTDRVTIARAALDGAPFDVAEIRAHCGRLIAEGERLAMERAVFADWARERTPDVPFAFRVALGWPGPLAREYGWERCKACVGKGRARCLGCDACPACEQYDKRLRCGACKGRGRTRKPGIHPGFANGDSIARTARRLLDTLDGRCPWNASAKAQASECQTCNGSGDGRIAELDAWSTAIPACPDCRGTGHNLSGVLPQVEYPARWRAVTVAPAGTVPEPGQFAGVRSSQEAATLAGIAGLAYQLRPAEQRTRFGDLLAGIGVGMMAGALGAQLPAADLMPGWLPLPLPERQRLPGHLEPVPGEDEP